MPLIVQFCRCIHLLPAKNVSWLHFSWTILQLKLLINAIQIYHISLHRNETQHCISRLRCSFSDHICWPLELLALHFLYIRGAFKKFCNSTIKKNRNVTNYTLFCSTTPTEFNAFATFFWQTVNSTKIEIFCLSLKPLLDSFLERFIVMIADRCSESSANWHDSVKISTLL